MSEPTTEESVVDEPEDQANEEGEEASDAGSKPPASSSMPSLQEDQETKRQKRLAMNRKAAQESRKRKKARIEELQRSVVMLTRDNTRLRDENERMRQALGAELPADRSSDYSWMLKLALGEGIQNLKNTLTKTLPPAPALGLVGQPGIASAPSLHGTEQGASGVLEQGANLSLTPLPQTLLQVLHGSSSRNLMLAQQLTANPTLPYQPPALAPQTSSTVTGHSATPPPHANMFDLVQGQQRHQHWQLQHQEQYGQTHPLVHHAHQDVGRVVGGDDMGRTIHVSQPGAPAVLPGHAPDHPPISAGLNNVPPGAMAP
mmetsp:Transcript_24334/g.71454  ORF Transcript_24334/g.71454 Transcript_24334/m.71454 type:complete len:316 (-) Transcript_24334:296-1243(-)